MANVTSPQNTEMLVGFEVYTVIKDPLDMNKDEEEAELFDRLGIKPSKEKDSVVPEGSYRKRYFNTSLFQIISIVEAYDEKFDTPIVIMELLNVLNKFEETLTVKGTLNSFIPYISLFGATIVEVKPAKDEDIQRIKLGYMKEGDSEIISEDSLEPLEPLDSLEPLE
jgi:hypothetical protein